MVRPDDRSAINAVFETNTCLWGGKFNPIIPIFKSTPSWWERSPYRGTTARRIIDGYLDFYEPDFVVEKVRGLAAGLGFAQSRVLQLDQLLPAAGSRGQEPCGLPVFEVYRHLYDKEYKFTHRHERNITGVRASDPTFSAFVACAFGSFPRDESLSYIRQGFYDAFEPRELEISGDTAAQVYADRVTSALRIGSADIRVTYSDRWDPYLFVLDPTSPGDLIDFWNFRTFQRAVIPIPKQWLGNLRGYCGDFARQNYRPLPGNPNGIMIRPTVLYSRSIDSDEIDDLHHSYFSGNIHSKIARQDWYPAIWEPTSPRVFREGRPTLAAREEYRSQTVTEAGTIEFTPLDPPFLEAGDSSHSRWANSVELHAYPQGQLALTYPTDYKDPKAPRFDAVYREVLPTTEGFIVFPRYRGIGVTWRLTDGPTAHKQWLQELGLNPNVSDAGRATEQVIATLGLLGVAGIADPGVLRLLDGLTRKRRAPTMKCPEFRHRLKDIFAEKEIGQLTFESLVRKNVVELGIELRCATCSSWTWHDLNALNYTVQCSLCRQEFSFPVADPNSNKDMQWAYRLAGPFALPDFAGGGYASALAIRFFAHIAGVAGHQITWSAGQRLWLGPGQTVETDLLIWVRKGIPWGDNDPTRLVLGEAKSFGKDAIGSDDVQRMKALAVRFPGAAIVFATMKEPSELSAKEISRIARFATWGRMPLQNGSAWRTPVILLTGIELFAKSLASAWRSAGEQHRRFADGFVPMGGDLEELAEATQQIYLNLPSHHEWLDKRFEKRRASRHLKNKAN